MWLDKERSARKIEDKKEFSKQYEKTLQNGKCISMEFSIKGECTNESKALSKTIWLCVDICRRNGIERLNFTGDSSGNLTMHKMFTATTCPGPYLESKMQYIANEVNKILSDNTESDDVLYRVQVGAYSVKENAERKLKELKSAGFDGFIVEVKR